MARRLGCLGKACRCALKLTAGGGGLACPHPCRQAASVIGHEALNQIAGLKEQRALHWEAGKYYLMAARAEEWAVAAAGADKLGNAFELAHEPFMKAAGTPLAACYRAAGGSLL